MDEYEAKGSRFDTVVSIGGGAKSPLWQQIQANIFNTKVVSLKNEQGPGLGAAMLAAVGLGWFKSVSECTKVFVKFKDVFLPRANDVAKYRKLHDIYKQIYPSTKEITHELVAYRRENGEE